MMNLWGRHYGSQNNNNNEKGYFPQDLPPWEVKHSTKVSSFQYYEINFGILSEAASENRSGMDKASSLLIIVDQIQVVYLMQSW